MGYYAKAEICLNGHIVSANSTSDNHENFCSKCGAKTISSCPNCKSQIRGWYKPDGVVVLRSSNTKFPLPAFCPSCGRPYPWTVSAIESTAALIEEDEEIPQEQKTKLIESLPDIVSETPRTKLAIVRLKKALVSVGKFTADGVRQFCIDFACELVKSSMGP